MANPLRLITFVDPCVLAPLPSTIELCNYPLLQWVSSILFLFLHASRWKEAFTNVRCSIGMYMVTAESPDAASVMSSADVACYSAKDMGRNRVHLYKDSDGSVHHEEMKWVSRITSAVDENRLELFYQPIIGIGKDNAKSRGHYELLLRMRDENGDIVNPVTRLEFALFSIFFFCRGAKG